MNDHDMLAAATKRARDVAFRCAEEDQSIDLLIAKMNDALPRAEFKESIALQAMRDAIEALNMAPEFEVEALRLVGASP